MASLKDGRTGEPIHPRKWDSSVMDLPIVNPRKQHRPALRVDAMNTLFRRATVRSKRFAFYLLLEACESLKLWRWRASISSITAERFKRANRLTGTSPALWNILRRTQRRGKLISQPKSQSTCEDSSTTGKDWDSMSFVGTARHGGEERDARRTSTISGWDISRRRCRNFTPAWSLNWNVASPKPKM